MKSKGNKREGQSSNFRALIRGAEKHTPSVKMTSGFNETMSEITKFGGRASKVHALKAIADKMAELNIELKRGCSTRELINRLNGRPLDETKLNTDIILVPSLNPNDGKLWTSCAIQGVNGKGWIHQRFVKKKGGKLFFELPKVD